MNPFENPRLLKATRPGTRPKTAATAWRNRGRRLANSIVASLAGDTAFSMGRVYRHGSAKEASFNEWNAGIRFEAG
jgi:hypothetical protein